MSSKESSAPTPWVPFVRAWTEMSKQVTKSVVEANKAAASVGFPDAAEPEGAALDTPGNVIEAPFDAMAYREPDWEFEGDVETPADLEVGNTVTFTKELTDADVRSFARASGDTNRLHLDQEFAESSRFGGRIVHGTLIAGLISAALARLPLLTIYLSQDLSFRRPAEIGEELTAVCEIVEDLGDGKYRLTTCVYNAEEETVIDGEAVVLIDELPSSAE
ncbi:MAG: MaoC family dehydratase [Halobacteriales archaeon]